MPSRTGSDSTGDIYSCVANANCNYDVHVLSCYEARSDHGFSYHPTGQSVVDISVTGQSSRPTVLVLASYEPIEWTLNIPSQIVIDTVIVVSYSSYSIDITHFIYLHYSFCRLVTTTAVCLMQLEEFSQ